MTIGAKPFPPLRTYGCVALIDDDDMFLQSLEEFLAADSYRIHSFTRPADLYSFFEERLPALEEEQRKIIEIGESQAELQGNVAHQALRFFTHSDRSRIPLVLVSDYAMPLQTGVAVCARYPYPGLQRILLTGVADDGVAVAAFNSAAIEQFVQKQQANFPSSLTSAVQNQLSASAVRRGAPLAAKLPKDLTSILASPSPAAALNALLRNIGVREYMLLGQPQGLLGVTADHRAVWVQLETQRSLIELEDLFEVAKIAQSKRKQVERGESLLAIEWMQQIGAPITDQPAIVLSAEPFLVAAVFPLDMPQGNHASAEGT